MTGCKDKIRIGCDALRALSIWKNGFLSFAGGSFALNVDRWQQYVDRVTHHAGTNSIGILSMAPWQVKRREEVLVPFKFNGEKFMLDQINPRWEAIMEQLIRSALEVEPDNLTLRLHFYDNCQFHHGATNPYLVKEGETKVCMNTGGWRHFFDVPWAVTLVYVDALLRIAEKFPGKIQFKIGNELMAREQKMAIVPETDGIAILPDALYVFRLAEYLVAKGYDRRDLGWGCTYGLNNVALVDGKWEVLQPNKSLQTHVNRIAERTDKVWNQVHREVHGLGAWDGKEVGEDTKILTAWYGAAHAGVADGSTDGANAKDSPYSSKLDRLVDDDGKVLYVRYNAEATGRCMDYILAKCGNKDTWLAVLPECLEGDAPLENALAVAASCTKRFGVKPWNLGRKWVKPAPLPPTPPPPEPPAPPPPAAPRPWWSWARIRDVRRWTWQAWLAVIALMSLACIALVVVI